MKNRIFFVTTSLLGNWRRTKKKKIEIEEKLKKSTVRKIRLSIRVHFGRILLEKKKKEDEERALGNDNFRLGCWNSERKLADIFPW